MPPYIRNGFVGGKGVTRGRVVKGYWMEVGDSICPQPFEVRENRLSTSENTILCVNVSVTGSGFRDKIGAFDITLSCYSDRIAENHLNCAGKHQNSR